MIEKTPDQLNAWKADIYTYEKNKRTKKPFGKSVQKPSYVTHHHVQQKQSLFNPVLQTYRHQIDEDQKNQTDEFKRAKSLMNHFKKTQKYQHDFDIVNLHSTQPYQAKEQSPNKLGPVRNIYNVVNNQKMPDFHFSKRQLRLPIERNKNLIKQNETSYNIVTGIFNENHEQKAYQETKQENQYIMKKCQKMHDYDPIFGQYYNEEKQKKYHHQRKVKESNHGKDYENRFPPSYVQRQACILDPSKPLPELLKVLDERKRNAKKRFSMKYMVQDDYAKRNVEDDRKYATSIKNRVHNNRVSEEKSKEFNIVSNKVYPETRAQDLYGKPVIRSTWERLGAENSLIKTGGFKM